MFFLVSDILIFCLLSSGFREEKARLLPSTTQLPTSRCTMMMQGSATGRLLTIIWKAVTSTIKRFAHDEDE